MTGVVRDAQPDDLDDICALIVELAQYEELAHEVAFDRDELAGHLFGPSPAARVLIAEVTDAEDRPVVAGFALWFTTFSTFLGRPGIWLEDLFVRPEHRGSGLGRALIEGLSDRTDGRVEWSVLNWNEPAIGFYESLGARPHAGWTTYRWAPEPGER